MQCETNFVLTNLLSGTNYNRTQYSLIILFAGWFTRLCVRHSQISNNHNYLYIAAKTISKYSPQTYRYNNCWAPLDWRNRPTNHFRRLVIVWMWNIFTSINLYHASYRVTFYYYKYIYLYLFLFASVVSSNYNVK